VRALGFGRRAVRALVPAALRPLAGRLVPRDRWLEQLALADVDWSSTVVFGIPGDGCALLRVNLAGREPLGTVDAPSRLRVVEEIIAALADLRDADTGERLVARAVPLEELWGIPPEGPLPDLCVEWREGPAPRAVLGPDGSELEVPRLTTRRSTHAPPGFLIGAGPGIRASESCELSGPAGQLVDVAPTVLASIGVDGPGTGAVIPRLARSG
jgi:predicted AlkP superfamily phosphohydrolase/phosphomutase